MQSDICIHNMQIISLIKNLSFNQTEPFQFCPQKQKDSGKPINLSVKKTKRFLIETCYLDILLLIGDTQTDIVSTFVTKIISAMCVSSIANRQSSKNNFFETKNYFCTRLKKCS